MKYFLKRIMTKAVLTEKNLGVRVYNQEGKESGDLKLNEAVFGVKPNVGLVHQVYVATCANAREPWADTKGKGEVRGGGKKPWKQKGTGQARSGAFRSPIWRKGGVTFAAKPQDYAQKVNKKMYKVAMRSIFSELLRKDRIILVEDFTVASNKTRDVVKKLKDLGLKEALIISQGIDNNLYLATRNLYRVGVCDAKAIDPESLVRFPAIVLTVSALKQIEEMLG